MVYKKGLSSKIVGILLAVALLFCSTTQGIVFAIETNINSISDSVVYSQTESDTETNGIGETSTGDVVAGGGQTI